MKMFVTGGAGFIGSHLVDLLLEKHHSVKILVPSGESLRNIDANRLEIVQGDVCDGDLLVRETQGIDIVYHLAARTDLDGKKLDDYRTNIEGTKNVVAAAEKNLTHRLVFFSSMLATSLSGSKDPIDESRKEPAPNPYGESKRIGESIVLNSSVSATIIRPTMVFGPRERSTMKAYFRAILTRRFFLIGSNVWQSFCYVKNLVMAAYQASLEKKAEGEIFFISDNRPYTLREFSHQAAKAFGVRIFPYSIPYALGMTIAYGFLFIHKITGMQLPLFPSRVKTMTTNYVYSIEKARRYFGYDSTYPLEEALEETAEWYLNHLD